MTLCFTLKFAIILNSSTRRHETTSQLESPLVSVCNYLKSSASSSPRRALLFRKGCQAFSKLKLKPYMENNYYSTDQSLSQSCNFLSLQYFHHHPGDTLMMIGILFTLGHKIDSEQKRTKCDKVVIYAKTSDCMREPGAVQKPKYVRKEKTSKLLCYSQLPPYPKGLYWRKSVTASLIEFIYLLADFSLWKTKPYEHQWVSCRLSRCHADSFILRPRATKLGLWSLGLGAYIIAHFCHPVQSFCG